ncbi:Cys-tRNA(Pro) deacylase [Lactobacillus sp. S2-2]|uniref:aminoacyl-tRNA deacylase n=1 Tax=Lactobacillus sp. S2-2 TaxID=2692917 RepID=UPI001F34FDCD|nr:aminoacyl-tRNA deacylase [Lactobacillus sp. S2-2]MCF6515281.1 Cys-tRNA(Pro) deacylase [Lactobacillus sp. S2-2]
MAKNKSKVHKTLVEQILDKNKIDYQQLIFETYTDGDVEQINVNHDEINQHQIYKTLALTTPKNGPIVGVVPLDERLSYKKLAKASGNKKVGMIPLKDLANITTYEHGANTPIGIYEKKGFPIFIDNSATEQENIIVSSGQIGRSVKLNAQDLAKLVKGTFADIIEN